MCGIAGIVKLNPRENVDPARVRWMQDVVDHRGPDGAGLVSCGPVGLGHRRLAIVDVAGGHQPMTNEDGSVFLVFNGEIYNHAELRPGLEQRGHVYKTRSDTETILHLYEERGERCVDSLRGMFAFAIWDRLRRRLLLARDRLGIKPLYYAVNERELLFASEIKAVLASGAVRPVLNEAALPELLANRFVSGGETLFRGVRELQPGRTLTWSPGEGLRERRYWHLPTRIEENGRSLVERAEDLRERLQASVHSHLMSDVPLGLFLSGGIDSSGLLALMAPLVKEPVRAFAVGFDEEEANELPYARIAARSAGAHYSEVVVSPQEFWQALPRLVWHEDEPIAFPSSVPLYFVSELAREHVKVVLTGEGADELFLGYNRYRVNAWNERLGRPYFRFVPESLREGISGLLKQLPRPLRRYTARSFASLRPGPRELFYENFALFPRPLRSRLLSDPRVLARDPYEEEMRCFEQGRGGSLDRMSRADLQTYLVRLLMKQDKMSMAASIESRVPFLDHELVEHVLAMPGHLKLRGFTTKAVLREALRPLLPRAILTRRKMGFPVPVGRWLRGPFWTLVDEYVLGPRATARALFEPAALRLMAQEHRDGKADHGDRLWLLINLEIWHRVFLEGEATARVSKAA